VLEEQVAHRRQTCPQCSAAVEADFLVCPVCATRLRESCARCDAPLERLWQMCPYCATPVADELDLEEALDAALTREAHAAPTFGLVADATRSSADV
jgi:RNA polymerase subunit RPABC4/transcription elongation factor Spt4